MTIRTQVTKVADDVVLSIAIDVINLKDKRLSIPHGSQTAQFALVLFTNFLKRNP